MSYLIIPYLLILFSANLLGSLAGFGGGMISIPLLVLLMDPKAVIVSSTMTCILNGIIALQHRKEILWREFALILGGMCLGLPVGVLALTKLPVWLLKGALGVLMIFVGAQGLWRQRHPRKTPPRKYGLWAGLGLLFAGGVLQGAISSGGSLVVLYARSRIEDRQAFRATLALIWMGTAIITTVQYFVAGALTATALELFLWSWPAVLVGILLGGAISTRIRQVTFVTVVNATILLAGLFSLGSVIFS